MTDDTMRRRRELASRAILLRRKELELTQEQVAQRAGVVVRTIHNIENCRWPNARTRALIENALQWEPGEIKRLTEPPPPRIDPELINATLDYAVEEIAALLEWRRQQERPDGRGLRIVNGGSDDD